MHDVDCEMHLLGCAFRLEEIEYIRGINFASVSTNSCAVHLIDGCSIRKSITSMPQR